MRLLHVQNKKKVYILQSRNGTPYNKTGNVNFCFAILVTMFLHIDMFSSWCIFLIISTVVGSLMWVIEYQTKLNPKLNS